MFDVLKVREDFPMLNTQMAGKKLVYLDNGATTFKPKSVINAVDNYYNHMTSNFHRGEYELSYLVDKAYEDSRKTIAKLLNCDEKEVVFTSGATGSLNLVAEGYGRKVLKENDVILTTLSEHASNYLPWLMIAREKGCRIEYIPLDEQGRVTVENFKKALHKEVKIVTLAAVSNVLGYHVDIKSICKLAHDNGSTVIVDGAQAVPHMKVDVRDWDCDFLGFSAHKMCGPSGVGILYGKYSLLNEMEPVNYGGGSNARFDSKGNLVLKEVPYKFEAGTPAIEAALGLKEAADYLMNLGLDEIGAHEKMLRDYLVAHLKEMDNVILYNPNGDTGIVTFNVKDIFAQDSSSYLATLGIALRSGNHCAKMLVDVIGTDATVRCSAYLYNTIEDMDALIEGIRNTTIENCIGTIF